MKKVLKGIRNLLRFYRFLEGKYIWMSKNFKASEIFFFNLIINQKILKIYEMSIQIVCKLFLLYPY